MRVLGLLRRSVNQARIRCRVLWLELSDRFKIGRVGHDFPKLLQLLLLIQFCFGLLLLNNSSAHDNSFFWLKLKGTPEQKIDNDKLETFAQLGATRFAADRMTSTRPASVKQMQTLPKALQSSAANQSRHGQNCFQVPTLDQEICDIR